MNLLNQKVIAPGATSSVVAENGNATFAASATTGTFVAAPEMEVGGVWHAIPAGNLVGVVPIVAIGAPVTASNLPAGVSVRLNVPAVAPDVDLQIQG